MEPQVFFSVCYDNKNPPAHIRQRHTFTPAILHGYSRRRVKWADYPGMIEVPPPRPSSSSSSSSPSRHRPPPPSVRGALVSGITKANLARLDYFEGSQYDRRVVRPRVLVRAGPDEATGQGNVEGATVVTESYVFLDARELEDKEWDFAEFKREKLQKWTRAGYVFEG